MPTARSCKNGSNRSKSPGSCAAAKTLMRLQRATLEGLPLGRLLCGTVRMASAADELVVQHNAPALLQVIHHPKRGSILAMRRAAAFGLSSLSRPTPIVAKASIAAG